MTAAFTSRFLALQTGFGFSQYPHRSSSQSKSLLLRSMCWMFPGWIPYPLPFFCPFIVIAFWVHSGSGAAFVPLYYYNLSSTHSSSSLSHPWSWHFHYSLFIMISLGEQTPPFPNTFQLYFLHSQGEFLEPAQVLGILVKWISICVLSLKCYPSTPNSTLIFFHCTYLT